MPQNYTPEFKKKIVRLHEEEVYILTRKNRLHGRSEPL